MIGLRLEIVYNANSLADLTVAILQLLYNGQDSLRDY